MTDGEIISLLEECGFYEGVRRDSVDVNEIQNEALARCHELSFLSVNIHGLVADVVVHERVTSPRAISGTPYNLVADADGVIVSSLVLEGQKLFCEGDTVFRGQLLVSGIVDSVSGGALLRHARGKVYARTHRTLTFEIPYRQTVKEYTHTETVRGIRVLGHSFYNRPEGIYDSETKERELRVLGVLLPVTLETRHIGYYTHREVVLTPDEAEAEAYRQYGDYLSTELDSGELQNEEFKVDIGESSLVLTAEVTALENIAIEKKIDITE